jgi:hypothetical protein
MLFELFKLLFRQGPCLGNQLIVLSPIFLIIDKFTDIMEQAAHKIGVEFVLIAF